MFVRECVTQSIQATAEPTFIEPEELSTPNDADGYLQNLAMKILGRCDCGNISFLFDWKSAPSEIPVRACTCSFCIKHGGVWTSCPGGSLKVLVTAPSLVSAYAIGTGTAQFHVCANCGVVPVATSRIDGRLYGIVNVNVFECIDSSMLRRTAVTFDGESETERLARRTRNWIADVEIVEGDAQSVGST